MADIQKDIQNLLDELVAAGEERGAQVTAYVNGELIVDAWSGVANATTGDLVDGDTLFPVFSTTKGIAATIIHLLAERGLLDYDMPVAKVWPEFAAHGKENITLRQCMSHTAGLPHLPRGLNWAQLHDWDTVCAAIAALAPSWPPGSRMEYHAMTYGWLLGEVAQRVDGRPFAQQVQEEICQPLGLKTLFTGVPAALEPGVALLEAPGFEMPVVDDTQPQAVPGWLQPLHEMMNRPEARRACQPASNGIMNARAIARHYAALLPGGVDGVELLPPERIPERIKVATEWQHLNNGEAICMGLGYMIIGGEGKVVGGDSAFGHGGHGGSLGFAHPKTGLAFGFTRNMFSPAPTAEKLMTALRDYLGES